MKNIILLLIFSISPAIAQNQEGEGFAIIDGVRINYSIKGNGPAMIVGHPTSGKVGYEISLQPLENRFTMIYYDPRGTGRSETPQTAQEYADERLVGEIEGLRNYFKIDKIWLFGHSDQSAIALQYALKFPNNVSGMVLSGTGYVGSYAEMLLHRQSFEQQRKQESDWFRQVVKDWDYMISKQTVIDSTGRDLSTAPVKWWCYSDETSQKVIPIAISVTAAGKRRIARDGSVLSAEDHTKQIADYVLKERQFSQINCHILIVNGKFDTNNPKEKVEKLHRILFRSKLLIIDKAGHFPWIEQQEAFYAETDKWLNSIKR
ncbi:MAG TPA: alpha/beta hydrolase [Flavobacterium sp.]|jgi:proline iminopeptidase